MPNGEQALEQDQEGEDSAEESGKWESLGEEEEEESEIGRGGRGRLAAAL